MNYTIRYKDLDKPLAIEAFIDKKLIKLEKFDWISDDVKIELRRYDKDNSYKAVMLIHPKGYKDIQAEARSDNLNTAIDLAIDKVVAQLIKIKETR